MTSKITSQVTDHPFRFNDEDDPSFVTGGLFESQLDEGCRIYGIDCVYISQKQAQSDDIFGEHLGNKLENGIPIRLICDQMEEDFQNEDTALHSKFGFQLNMTEAVFHASISYFEDHDITISESDIIYYKKVEKAFEIMKVTRQDQFKVRLDCDLYTFDNIEIDEFTIDEPAITDLKHINDEEMDRTNQPVLDQVVDEGVKTGRSDGIYDV